MNSEKRRKRAKQCAKENRMQRNSKVKTKIQEQPNHKNNEQTKVKGGFRQRTLDRVTSLFHKDDK